MAHPLAERLIEAQLQHILSLLQSGDQIIIEVNALVDALSSLPVSKLVTLESLQSIAQQYILDRPLQPHIAEQIVAQVRFALNHPKNSDTTLESLIPQDVVENLAQYLSSQKDHREALIHRIFSNPTYAQMLSQTISHAITDYMDNNVLTKKVPGVGGLMKLGKNMIERATDSNLDDALKNYLNKNINNIIAVSEKMANRHLNDQQVHQLIIQGWKSIRKKPVSIIQKYITEDGINEAAVISTRTWDVVRKNPYLQAQVQDGIAHWYDNNKDTPLSILLADVHLDKAMLEQEIRKIALPIIQLLIDNGYVKTRVEALLRQFYESDAVTAILAD